MDLTPGFDMMFKPGFYKGLYCILIEIRNEFFGLIG